jgi:tRNA threonylcarbamoyladenosine biosynthesis protein TsaB
MRHGRALLPMIESALAEAGVDKRALDVIAAGVGPGSYTGLRVGLAAARTLSFALDVPIFGVPSFDAMADALSTEAQSVVVAVDAYQLRIYRGVYRRDGARLVRQAAIDVVESTRVLDEVGRPAAVCGGAVTRYPEVFAVEGVSILSLPAVEDTAAAVATRGLDARLRGESPSPETVLPLYLRPSLPAPSG